jgi:hypothetical protein
MSRCSICQHPKRAQLELGLILGTSMRVLAARFDCPRAASLIGGSACRDNERNARASVKAFGLYEDCEGVHLEVARQITSEQAEPAFLRLICDLFARLWTFKFESS